MMEIEDDGEASIFYALKTCFNSGRTDNDVLVMGKHVTYHLHEAQYQRTIQGSVIVVITGTVQESGKQCVAMIKAGKQSGFSLADTDGEKILQFYNDLLLTKNQKFHKIGFLSIMPCKVEKLVKWI